MLTELGLAGDQQAERKIHGGPDRAMPLPPRTIMLIDRQFPSRRRCFAPRRLARICRRTE
ncbi:hypothetical protein KCP70_12550 [Salmonella enterica subsp. enterica]|nr:hypothetical protein KCP70_12550 [Salmonella enterica subsp. enterica]